MMIENNYSFNARKNAAMLAQPETPGLGGITSSSVHAALYFDQRIERADCRVQESMHRRAVIIPVDDGI